MVQTKGLRMRILFDGRIFLHLFYLEVHCGTLYRSCFYIKACKVIWSWIILMMIVIIITSIMAHGFISLLFSRWRGNLSKYWWTNQRYSLRISWDSWKCLGERKYFRSSLLELKSNHRKYRRKRIEKVIFCKGQWCEVCRHEILFDERIEGRVMDKWKGNGWKEGWWMMNGRKGGSMGLCDQDENELRIQPENLLIISLHFR